MKLATEEGFPTFPLLLFFLLFNKKIIICLFSILWCLKGSVKCCCLHEGEDEWIGGGRVGDVLPAFISIFLTALRGRSVLIYFVLAKVVLVLVKVDSWKLLWRGKNLYSWWWWTSGDKPFPPVQSSQGGCLSTPWILLCRAEGRVWWKWWLPANPLGTHLVWKALGVNFPFSLILSCTVY